MLKLDDAFETVARGRVGTHVGAGTRAKERAAR